MTRKLGVRRSKKAPFWAPTAYERIHCFSPFWTSQIRKMDQPRHKTMFHGLISQMEHVFVNSTCCGSLTSSSIMTAMMTLHGPPVKKVYPITTESGTCMKGGCKVAFFKGWALQSRETGLSLKTGEIVQGCTPTQQCTGKQVVTGPEIGNSYWLGSAEPSSIETTNSTHELHY